MSSRTIDSNVGIVIDGSVQKAGNIDLWRTEANLTTKQQFSTYVNKYLEISKLDYVTGSQGYQAVVDEIYRQYVADDQVEKVNYMQNTVGLDVEELSQQLLQHPAQRTPIEPHKQNMLSEILESTGEVDSAAISSLIRGHMSKRIFGFAWHGKGLAYVKQHPQWVAWIILLGIAHVGVCIWMIFWWKDTEAAQSKGPQLLAAKCGAQIMKLDFALLPLTVLRGIHACLENRGFSWILPKNGMLHLHKLLGQTIMLAMLLHVFSHMAIYIDLGLSGRGYYLQLVWMRMVHRFYLKQSATPLTTHDWSNQLLENKFWQCIIRITSQFLRVFSRLVYPRPVNVLGTNSQRFS